MTHIYNVEHNVVDIVGRAATVVSTFESYADAMFFARHKALTLPHECSTVVIGPCGSVIAESNAGEMRLPAGAE